MTLGALLLRALLPNALKRRLLTQLFATTAAGFGRPAPDLRGLGYEQRLRRYAMFTRDEAERCLSTPGNATMVRAQLHDNARCLGAQLRRRLGTRSTNDSLVVGRWLYRNIGIDLRPGPQGAITVNRCYFADFYPAAVCRLISALDEGLFEGLSGGGQLEFTERVTEGSQFCRAQLHTQECLR